ncbi:arylsulfatase [Lederbergia lenta]|uniref:arylsulfatase n=1 Tax=Lederbergia lenta TaxID=1467 RepID=UPI00203C43AE|nr:arylsulfatase [Lederbergia lenta]MCM3111893.1 arylsulfatase [Lederbergia lenta]
MGKSPNILIILNDDMGYSDIGCYGGEVDTPNLDTLAEQGVRFTQFYNTARCSPSRASLLTGLHPHQTGIGILTDDDGPEGYAGNLNKQCVTIPEVLKGSNYSTFMSGKWHVANDFHHVSDTWPKQRGFDQFYGTIAGAGSYYDPKTLTRDNENIECEAQENDDFYYTDAISDNAVRFIQEHVSSGKEQPFFQYVAYTAPHWPLHAPKEVIDKYKGRFNSGWDKLREQRLERMIDMGIIEPHWKLSERDASQPLWEDAENKEWRQRCMEVYAAQIDRMDQGIGRIINVLKETNQLEDTIIIFLSDNGGCAEEIGPDWGPRLVKNSARAKTRSGEEVIFGDRPEYMPGPENTYQSYGIAWANVSNTPFKLYKHWVHEGGIATPLIVHWPKGIKAKGAIRHSPAQLTDIMATVLDVTGASYPESYKGNKILPLEGQSIVPFFEEDIEEERPLYWEHEGNSAIRIGKWKLVKRYPGEWELYDMQSDRTEHHNVAYQYPKRVAKMIKKYDAWAKRCGVIPREKILKR